MKKCVYVPEILLPRCDLGKWAVVACDQFTSDKDYWKRIDEFIGSEPSALRLILPECFLGEVDEDKRQAEISETMRKYYRSGLFRAVNSYVLVKRKYASGAVRTGLMAAIDLETYDYRPSEHAEIRATEGTVEDRLPPRVKIRSASIMELPHIMLLIDDPDNSVFGAAEHSAGETLYDFDLCGGGGSIVGKRVTDTQAVDDAFDRLAAGMRERFGEDLLMLVGDGNHSLAAAKKCYEQAKASGDESAELKRFALCEIVNIYDEGIVFEPIHRALFGVNPEEVASLLNEATHEFPVPAVVRGGGKEYAIRLPQDNIAAIAFVQDFLDKYVSSTGAEIDYIHGDDVLYELSERADCLTISFKPIGKNGFTEYIVQNGVLPRKTFSMGEACEKRYYLEARLIAKP